MALVGGTCDPASLFQRVCSPVSPETTTGARVVHTSDKVSSVSKINVSSKVGNLSGGEVRTGGGSHVQDG